MGEASQGDMGASVFKVLGMTVGPRARLTSVLRGGEVDSCHQGINMIFLFSSLALGGQVALPPLTMEGHGIQFWGLFSG